MKITDDTQGFADRLYNGPVSEQTEDHPPLRESAITEADREWLRSERPTAHLVPVEGWVMPEAGDMGTSDGLGA